MPVRKIPIGYHNVTGRFPSSKLGRTIAYESLLERDLFLSLEFDRQVRLYEEQPLKVCYRDEEGCERTYTPDVLVHYRDNPKPVLGEVKYAEAVRRDWPALRRVLRAGCNFAAEHGWEFRFFTERSIRTSALPAIHFLLPYLRRSPDLQQEMAILRSLQTVGKASAQVALAMSMPAGGDRGDWLPSLWRLTATGQVEADLDKPITMQTLLRYCPTDAEVS